LGAPKTQPDVERRRGSGSIEIKQILSATSRETLFSGTACPGLVIAPVYYYRRLLSPTSNTHIGLLSPPFSASATSWRLLGHQQARLQIRVRFWPWKPSWVHSLAWRRSLSAAPGAPRPRQMMRIDKSRSLIQAPRSRWAAPNPWKGMCHHLTNFRFRPMFDLGRPRLHLSPYVYPS